TGSGESLFVTERSAAGLTVVVSGGEVLFPESGSGSLPEIEAWLESVPACWGVTLIVIVAEAPLASAPSAQVTVPALCEQLPWLALAETKVTLAGRVSVTLTPVAPEGPLFLAVRV